MSEANKIVFTPPETTQRSLPLDTLLKRLESQTISLTELQDQLRMMPDIVFDRMVDRWLTLAKKSMTTQGIDVVSEFFMLYNDRESNVDTRGFTLLHYTVLLFLKLLNLNGQTALDMWFSTLTEDNELPEKVRVILENVLPIISMEYEQPGLTTFYNKGFDVWFFGELFYRLDDWQAVLPTVYRDWQKSREPKKKGSGLQQGPKEFWEAQVADELLSYGIDFDVQTQLFDTWRLCGLELFATVIQNLQILRKLAELEKKDRFHPKPEGSLSCIQTLINDFGIHCFYRYDANILYQQYKNARVQGKYGVVINPKADYNNAFANESVLIRHLSEQLDGKMLVRIMEVNSKEEIAFRLLAFRRRYLDTTNRPSKVEFMVLGGHGTKTSLELGKVDHRPRSITVTDLSERHSRLRRLFFSPHFSLVLNSCSTGEKKGLGEHLNKTFDITVSAPVVPTVLTDVVVRREKNTDNYVLEGKYGVTEANRFLPAASLRQRLKQQSESSSTEPS